MRKLGFMKNKAKNYNTKAELIIILNKSGTPIFMLSILGANAKEETGSGA